MPRRPRYEVADVIRRFGPEFRNRAGVCRHHLRTLSALEQCRTAALGGHRDTCTDCGATRLSYNSCRNRHCPKCGGLRRELWINARRRELLPVPYQHIVFTLPEQLNPLCRYDPNFCYNLLFRAAWHTLKTFGEDERWLGARPGATMALHTWGQNLSLHPHVHCIVPAGGLRGESWRQATQQRHRGFLFPVKAMARVYRATFLRQLRRAWLDRRLNLPPNSPTELSEVDRWLRPLHRKGWVVYAKVPFGGPEAVVEYLGRYTHKVAISNHRILEIKDGRVTFTYKDYRQQGKPGVMSLTGKEFLRRFCLHILPPGFRRLRHYGILSNALKGRALTAARVSLQVVAPPPCEPAERRRQIMTQWLGHDPDTCQDCGAKGTLIRILIPPCTRAPPTTCTQRRK